jgi:HSP20 family protein
MLTRFGDFDTALGLMDELRRRMDRVWDDFEPDDAPWTLSSATWPRINVFDAGANLVLKADVPGMSDKDLSVSLQGDTLSISGERKQDAPTGYVAHRQERGAVRFARSLYLPCKVNAEQVSAAVRDGVLTITLHKAPEAQPRQITVRAQS